MCLIVVIKFNAALGLSFIYRKIVLFGNKEIRGANYSRLTSYTIDMLNQYVSGSDEIGISVFC